MSQYVIIRTFSKKWGKNASIMMVIIVPGLSVFDVIDAARTPPHHQQVAAETPTSWTSGYFT